MHTALNPPSILAICRFPSSRVRTSLYFSRLTMSTSELLGLSAVLPRARRCVIRMVRLWGDLVETQECPVAGRPIKQALSGTHIREGQKQERSSFIVSHSRDGIWMERSSRHQLLRDIRGATVLGLPVGWYGKRFVSVCLPRDGNGAGRWEATWLTGRDCTISWWDGTERDRKHSREIGRECGRETLSGMVGNTMGNWGWKQRLKKREMLRSPIYAYTTQCIYLCTGVQQ